MEIGKSRRGAGGVPPSHDPRVEHDPPGPGHRIGTHSVPYERRNARAGMALATGPAADLVAQAGGAFVILVGDGLVELLA